MEEVTLELTNQLSELGALADAVGAFAQAHAVSEEARAHMVLALEEVVTNVIRHGGARRIRVRLQLAGPDWVATVEDDGIAFDPLAHPEPEIDQDVEDRPIGGLGVFLVRRLMDSVEYRRQGGQNVLIVKKRCSGEHAGK